MNLNRKTFFERIGKVSLFVALSSALPFKVFGTTKKIERKIKIEIHPSAVKRINKV